jgi:hypothetical protein
MKKAKAPRVPVLENAFELNLPKLMRTSKASGSSRLVLDDGDVKTVAVLAETRLAVFLGGQQWVVHIVTVRCLRGRVRPLLKCPRAHEGSFQSLYFRAGDLACRHCHALRYRTNLAAKTTDRAQIKRMKLLIRLGGEPGGLLPARVPGTWRKRYNALAEHYGRLTVMHYTHLKNVIKDLNKLS